MGLSKGDKDWGNWKANSARGNVDPQELLFEMEKVLIQLRKDMGLKRGLRQGDLLRLNLSDIDDVIEEKKTSWQEIDLLGGLESCADCTRNVGLTRVNRSLSFANVPSCLVPGGKLGVIELLCSC